MSFEVGRVKLTSGSYILRRVSGHDARASQTIEVFHSRARLAAKDASHNFAQCGVSRQQNQDATQVIAIRPFVAVSHSFKGIQAYVLADHLVQPAPHQVGMAAQELEEARKLIASFEWRVVTRVQLAHLLKAKIF